MNQENPSEEKNEEIKIPRGIRRWLNIGKALKKEQLEKAALSIWEKSIVKQEDKLKEKIRENRENAEKVLRMFDNVYVIEDTDGKPYTKEKLDKMTHQEMIKTLEFYLNELKKDVGEEDE